MTDRSCSFCQEPQHGLDDDAIKAGLAYFPGADRQHTHDRIVQCGHGTKLISIFGRGRSSYRFFGIELPTGNGRGAKGKR